MKKTHKIIPALLFVFITGCTSNNTGVSVDNEEILEVKTEIETKMETETIEELSDITNILTENNKEEKDMDMEKFKGKNYTFYKTEMDNYHNQLEYGLLHKIKSVYEEHQESEYHGLFLGQVVTLFGSENLSENNEDLISHAVAAENEDGEIIYLEVYYGQSGPAIGGMDGENFEEAAKELEDIIRNTIPVDFECSSVYEDVGVSIRMGTKDGKGFYETDFDEMDFEKMDF